MIGPIPRPPTRLVVCSANFGRGKPPHVFAENFRNVVDRLNEISPFWVLGCQEIDEADAPNEHHIIARMLPQAEFAGWETRTPIIVSPRARIVRPRVTKASRGLTSLSPARQIVEAVVEIDGDELGFVNTHFPRWTPRLVSRWWTVWRKLRRRVRVLRRTHETYYTTDANRRNLRKVNRHEHRLAWLRLDYAGRFKARGQQRFGWRVVAIGTVNLTIDGHDAVYAVLERKE